MSIFRGFLVGVFTCLLQMGVRNSFCLALTPMLFAAPPASTIKLTRLYVEPFTTQSQADRLRDQLISELHRNRSISIVTSASAADAVLDGGGEIWVKSYESLNPKSGRLPSNGRPIYNGYLSVELKDPQGQTFWSYLATPAFETADVSKDLAKLIARHVSDAMQAGEPAPYVVAPSKPATVLRGAGATFPAPVYEKWFKNYRRENPNLEITYDAVGSEAGIQQLLGGKVDFGATDSPEAIRDLAPDRQNSFLLLPTVVGAVVPIVNLPGLAHDVSLTPEALAGIYLGKIKKWNDPLIKLSNRGVRLPDLDIVVVHRSDGSGTSYAWTDYLSKTVPEWRTAVGSSLTPKWPVGRGGVGNDGVAKLVKELGGSIGYVEFVYALQNHLNSARVRNQNGEFVAASLEGMAVAASQGVRMSDDLKVSIVNAPGSGAYPISSFTWMVIPSNISTQTSKESLKTFLQWMLGPGQTQAAALGYLALPEDVVRRVQTAVSKID